MTEKRLWLQAFKRWADRGADWVEERPIEAALLEAAVNDYEQLEERNEKLSKALAERIIRDGIKESE